MERQRKNVRCGPTSVSSTKGFYDSGAFALSDYDNGLNITEFQENLDVIIQTVSERELVFDLVGVDAPVANALRRILIGELPTMAIEYVYIHNNSSVIQDEVLAHRMGLLPVQADPRLFEFAPKPEVDPSDDELKHKPEANNTLEFRLKVKCTRQGNTVVNSHVTSSMLEWVPLEGQEHLAGPNQPGIVDDDIVIARLGPGQEIDLTCHCIKGIGREHAKWSPVCTASYRLLPVIKVDESFPAAHAEDLVRKCPMGVFEIEELGKIAHHAALSVKRTYIVDQTFNSIQGSRKQTSELYNLPRVYSRKWVG